MQLQGLNPQFLNTPLISAKKLPEKGDELAFQRLACIPQMPCPTGVSRKKKKKSPIEKIHIAVEISAVTGPGGAKPQPPNVSLLMPRSHSQRESDLIGPPLWAQCVISRSPSGRICVYSPGEGQTGGGAGPVSPFHLFPQRKIFQKLPR